MNATIKKILMAGGFGVIASLLFMLIIYTGAGLIGWVIFALILFCAYALWNKRARTELMKREENFDILKSDKK
jgi:hypothetical protein